MEKSELVNAILTRLLKYRDTTIGISLLIEEVPITDQVIQSLYQTLYANIMPNQHNSLKQKIRQSADLLKMLHKKDKSRVYNKQTHLLRLLQEI